MVDDIADSTYFETRGVLDSFKSESYNDCPGESMLKILEDERLVSKSLRVK